MRYLVTWQIDSDAETPEAAAREALAAITRPDSIAHVFDVDECDTGVVRRVDLNGLGADAPGVQFTAAERGGAGGPSTLAETMQALDALLDCVECDTDEDDPEATFSLRGPVWEAVQMARGVTEAERPWVPEAENADALWCCPECGSTDIQCEAWVPVNGGPGVDVQDCGENWCPECEEHFKHLVQLGDWKAERAAMDEYLAERRAEEDADRELVAHDDGAVRRD